MNEVYLYNLQLGRYFSVDPHKRKSGFISVEPEDLSMWEKVKIDGLIYILRYSDSGLSPSPFRGEICAQHPNIVYLDDRIKKQRIQILRLKRWLQGLNVCCNGTIACSSSLWERRSFILEQQIKHIFHVEDTFAKVIPEFIERYSFHQNDFNYHVGDHWCYFNKDDIAVMMSVLGYKSIPVHDTIDVMEKIATHSSL